MVKYLQLKILDEFQIKQPRIYEDAAVTIVDIDDESLARLGQWPWPRQLLAEINSRLAKAGAAVIAYDVVFAEQDRTSPHILVPQWAKAHGFKWPEPNLPNYDASFAESLKNSPSVMGYVMTNNAALPPMLKTGLATVGGDPKPMAPAFTGAISSLPELTKAATGNGALNSVPDPDGIIRKVPLFHRVANQLYPSLMVEALRVAQGASTVAIKSVSDESGAMTDIRIGQFTVPTDKHGRLWIYFTPYTKERYLPVWKVLEPDFDPAQVQGKIILIGTSAAGLKDIRSTPLDPVSSGVEVHAQAIEQVVLGKFISRPDWMVGAEIMLMMVVGIGIIIIVKRVSPLMGAIISVVVIACALLVSWYLFHQYGLIVEPVTPSLAIGLVYLTEALFLSMKTDQERRRVRNAFKQYMSPALVEQLAANPDKLKLGGESREMSILFSDIRGFTTISEQMNAHDLTRFLNRFLTPMTEVIMSNRGTIDKYIGDCIMAFWNAPLNEPEHAIHACKAALAMTKTLELFNASLASSGTAFGTFKDPVRIGIGINTGECSVGNMGSDMRFDYSVLGDHVNLASRLEGQCKEYGVMIIIGENTVAAAPHMASLELDLIRVKGKQNAVRIYTLLGDETFATTEVFKTLKQANENVLAAYRAKRWEDARSALKTLEKHAKQAGCDLDGLCAAITARISMLEKATLPDNWDGVFVATSK